MSAPVNVAMISQVLTALLEQSDWEIEVFDEADETTYTVAPADAAAPDGFLPVFLRAADAVWREATGKSFGIDIRRSPTGTLGYTVEAIAVGPASVVMLCMLEAIEQAADFDRLLINNLRQEWALLTARRTAGQLEPVA